ncbi:MAG: aminomethyl-transferring glycine dehydrogenase subunit GcvPA [Pseudomonadales bacterium]|jgi:glycine dehydrogenase subunit 1|nr:aminomethyl-transferring glycine dehydrogenase subunit GcvPA [Pseudomonadales bacterium]
MPFIPHTSTDVEAMLDVIGVPDIDTLFDEVPERYRAAPLAHVPEGVSEMEMLADLGARAALDEGVLCFAGAGAYDHHIPAAIWDLVSRGEFMTAYTPYQAEASQGTLQVIYEYQSMIAGLTAMDAANASVYDGGSGLAEACLMAVRANRTSKSKRILVAGTLHPLYRAATETIVGNQGIELVELAAGDDGTLPQDVLAAHAGEDYAALVIQQPNFLGALEEVDALTDAARAAGMLVVAVVNPIALGLLAPPGEWGTEGADIVVGDGQPLGIPMASGGPYFGFMCCREKLVRQMPGRIIGRTVDTDGRVGYTLTLQAREQHIRRGKATSNICTNQGLLVTAGTIYMALMGHEGIARVAGHSHARTRALVERLTAIDGVERTFEGPFFHEAVLTLPTPAAKVVEALAEERILAGVALSQFDATRTHELLVCATEKRTEAEIERFAQALTRVLAEETH